MSRGATLSILGLYQFDQHILDNFQLPASVDKDILFPDLLAECAELEIIYPDPSVFKTVLKSWSGHRVKSWDRMAKAAEIQYDPLENYDRREEWTDTGSGTTNSSVKNYSAGYNPNNTGDPPGMVQQEQADGSGNNSGVSAHSGRVHGNIGVTTSQQMLTQELEVSDRIDIYRVIIQDFKGRFCIPLY